ncbi:MAG: ABC transporter permease [Rhizobiaceae bacterium]|nr:ABC transporter permease [Rhizobiaceae bacterium]
MNEPIPTHYAKSEAAGVQKPAPDPAMRDREMQSIVPRESVAGSALTLVIAIMAFLSSLTLGAVSLVNDTAQGWQNQIAREVTIQVRPVADVDITTAVESARQIASSFAGISTVEVVDEAQTNALLEPWLGAGLSLEELPLPRLITVIVDSSNPPDIAGLSARIVETVPGATVDDHRAWIDRLTTMATTTILVGVFVFILIMAATILTVIFATRGAMAGNRHVIEVLHFVGAEQSFIAGEFQRHFLFLGLKGAMAGGALALISFLVVGIWAQSNVHDPTADQVNALFGTFSVGLGGYVGTVVLVFIIGLLTAITSRHTVIRHVDALDGIKAVHQSSN